jgi:hypothetical protein
MFLEMMSITSSGSLTILIPSSEAQGLPTLIEHLILMVMGSSEDWAFSCGPSKVSPVLATVTLDSFADSIGACLLGRRSLLIEYLALIPMR